MHGLSFREITEKEIAIIEKWYGMTDCFGYATGFRDFSEVRQRLIDGSSPDRTSSVITYEGKTIGFVSAEIIKTANKPLLWIYVLMIEPDYQNRGYGTWAVNRLADIVKSRYDSLTCVAPVSLKNKKGLCFWESLGFRRSYDLEKTLEPDRQVAIYVRDISFDTNAHH